MGQLRFEGDTTESGRERGQATRDGRAGMVRSDVWRVGFHCLGDGLASDEEASDDDTGRTSLSEPSQLQLRKRSFWRLLQSRPMTSRECSLQARTGCSCRIGGEHQRGSIAMARAAQTHVDRDVPELDGAVAAGGCDLVLV